MSNAQVQRAVAGAGKTHWLVDQYIDLVVDQQPPLDPNGVVVITFTEAAARELVDRVRRRLTEIVRGTDSPSPAHAGQDDPLLRARRALRAQAVLRDLGSAPIGTIHSFARRILLQNAPAVGVPFGVDVVDALKPSVLAATSRRIDERIALQSAAHGLASRDLQRDNNNGVKYLRQDAQALLTSVSGSLLRAPSWAGATTDSLLPLEQQAWTQLRTAQQVPTDVLRREHVHAHLDLLAAAYQDPALLDSAAAKLAGAFHAKLALLADLRNTVGHGDPQEAFAKPLKQGNSAVMTKPMRTHCTKVGREDVLTAATEIDDHNTAVVEWKRRRHEAYARVAGVQAVEAFVWGRSSGGSDWVLQDELLQKCLVLIRDDAAIREALRLRYPRVLLDEAQDVDATQRELLVLLAGASGLTIVGDPQQSIYGFRGADHATFDQLSAQLLPDAAPKVLTTTRRCAPVIVDAVNAVFAADPHHTEMSAFRKVSAGSVTVLHAEAVSEPNPEKPDKPIRPKSEDYRRAQADAMADQVVRFLGDDGPDIWDSVAEVWRRARPADIAILVPSRTPVPDLEQAMRARNVPTTVRTSRDMARHPAAEGLAAATLAILQQQDTRALLLALRSPLFALTDEDITAWVFANGRLRIPPRQLQPDPAAVMPGSATGAALETLRQARSVLSNHGPGRAAAFLADQQSLAAGLAASQGSRWIEGWSQVRLLIDTLSDHHAGAVEPTESTAQWLRDQLSLAGRTNMSVLHEPQAGGVTITTVHQAKGLQWPVVMVASLQGKDDSTAKLTLVDHDVHTHLNSNVRYPSAGSDDDGQAPPELARLMYVAMTRAQDHLVISGIGPDSRGAPAVVQGDHITERLADLSDPRITVTEVVVNVGQEAAASPAGLPSTRGARQGPGEVRMRLAAVAEAAGKTLIRATPSAAGHGTQSAETKPATPPRRTPPDPRHWRPAPGRANILGNYVHGILERVDLAHFCNESASLDEALSSALPITDALTEDERAAAQRILGHAARSPLLTRAAHAVTCRRELEISGHSESDGVLTVTQGSIDLLFAEQNSGGGGGRDHDLRWVLVDYKTDSTDRTAADFVALYRPQLVVYEQLLAAVGIQVAEKWLLRLTPEGVEDTAVT